MITVTFCRTDAENSLTAEGHAGWAESGRDVVCAAVSALIFSLAQAVEKRREPCDTEARSAAVLCEGEARIRCGRTAVTDAWFSLTVNGLSAIARQYPGFIRIRRNSL